LTKEEAESAATYRKMMEYKRDPKKYDYTRDYGVDAYWADHKEAKDMAKNVFGHDDETAHKMATRAVDEHQKNGKYSDNRTNFERLNRSANDVSADEDMPLAA
jgi:hypothetical protein